MKFLNSFYVLVLKFKYQFSTVILRLRRGWAPKNFKHVRSALEHFVALEVLERERKSGRKAKWLYRKAARFNKRVVMVEKDEC